MHPTAKWPYSVLAETRFQAAAADDRMSFCTAAPIFAQRISLSFLKDMEVSPINCDCALNLP